MLQVLHIIFKFIWLGQSWPYFTFVIIVNDIICFFLNQGSGLLGSSVLQGMVFKKHVEGTLNHAEKAKIAVYSCPVDSSHTETKVRWTQLKRIPISKTILSNPFRILDVQLTLQRSNPLGLKKCAMAHRSMTSLPIPFPPGSSAFP